MEGINNMNNKSKFFKIGLLSITSISILYACSKGSNENSSQQNNQTSSELNKQTFLFATSKKSNSVFACPLDNETGIVGECKVTGSNFNEPSSLAVVANKYMYVANKDSVTKCEFNASTGQLTNCAPAGIHLVPQIGNYDYNVRTYKNEYIYFLGNNYGENNKKCEINQKTGELSSCVDFQLENTNLTDMVVNGEYAYIVSAAGKYILSASIDKFGKLSNPSFGYGQLPNLNGIAILKQGNPSKPYLYYANVSGTIEFCTINETNGQLTNCPIPEQVTHIDAPKEIKFHNGRAFVLSKMHKTISSCDVSKITSIDGGILNKCSETKTVSEFDDFLIKDPS